MSLASLTQKNLYRNCYSLQCLQFSSIIYNITPARLTSSVAASNSNPLLKIKKLPKYNDITGDSIKDGVPVLINRIKTKFKEFETNLTKSTAVRWDDVFPVSDHITDELGLAWSAVVHLLHVRNTPSLRDAYEKTQPDVVSLFNTISQSKAVYNALKSLNTSSDIKLDEAQLRIITSSLRSARNSGVHLEGKEKEEFNDISKKLAERSTKFVNNVLDSTKEFSHIIHNKDELDGLPTSLKTLMATTCAAELNKTIDPEVGPWKLSLDLPCFQPFMKNSFNEDLRKKLYVAYITRASAGSFSYSDIIEEIRALKKRKANILGFTSYADLSLESKMAKDSSAVWQLINDLKEKSKPAAIKELEDLQKFALENGYAGNLNLWDIPFWSERQKEKLFNLQEEKLKEFFPFEKVLEGLFSLSKEIFSLNILECTDGSVETWHADVKYFKVYDNDGSHLASFFLDPFSRPAEKNGGAWMDSALDKNVDLNRKPIAYLVCNQSPPIDNTPSLMTFREIETLFHEFGHGLQHMLTTVQYPQAAGINNIEWDAVELPSQFMENWLYDWYTIQKISSHYKTSESLPKETFDQLLKSRQYQAGLATMRQVYLSALDITMFTTDADWRSVMEVLKDEYMVIKPLEEDAFPCAFNHIFGGGYSAGYYSYKWAEVLSADAFASFDEVGLEKRSLVEQLGRRFRNTILAEGGSKHPEKIFMEFKGRKPTVDALIKSYGF